MEDLQRQLSVTQSELDQAKAYIQTLEARLGIPSQAADMPEIGAQHNHQLERVAARLSGLHAIDHAIINAHSLEELAESALVHVIKLVPCQRATVMSVDVDAQTAFALALYSKHETRVPTRQTYPLALPDLDAIRENRYVIYNNLASHVNRLMRQLYHEGLRTILTIGLKAEDKLIGILNLHSAQLNAFDEDAIQIALEVADQMAIGMHTTSLKETVRKYVIELEDWVAQRTESLAKEKANVEAILNSSTNAILLVDAAQQAIQQVNATFSGMFGMTSAAALGKPIISLIHADDQATLQTAIQTMLTFKTIQRLELRAVHADGTLFEAEVGLAPVKTASEALVQFVCTIGDITERKRVERDFRASEQRFRLMVNSVEDYAIYMLDPNGRVVSWNSGAQRLKGYQDTEIIGQSFEVFYTPEDRLRGTPQHVLKTAIETGSYVGEGWRVRKDGRQFWASVVVTALHDADGQLIGFSKITRDLTERNRAEQALRESEQRFRLLVNGVQDYGIYSLDPHGNVVSWNVGAERIKGYRDTEIIGKPFDVFYTPEDRLKGEPQHVLQTAIETGSFVGEGWRVRKDGSRFWASVVVTALHEADGKLIGFSKITRDLTERNRVEEILRASEQKYRALVETMHDGVVMFDLEHKITYVNTRFASLLGYEREELIGTYPYDYTDAVNAQTLQVNLENPQSDENRVYEVTVKNKDGSLIDMLVAQSRLVDSDGKPTGSFAVWTDISTFKNAEATLRQGLKKEHELSELKSRFIAITSHEFRTPLSIILATSDTLINYRDKLNDRQITQKLFSIQQQVDRLKEILENILELGRIQSGRIALHPTHVNVHALCRDIVEAFQLREKDQTRIEYACDTMPLFADVDAHFMGQIINNLLSNALKYSPAKQPVQVTLTMNPATFTLQVRDFGMGIPPDDIPHLFEPFHRATNVIGIGGTGVGLSIVKEAVDLHGGSISVDSQIGQGTTFIVTIPLSPA